MSDFVALHSLRIGCVRYLNSKPLIHSYDGAVTFDHPSALARDLAAGALDAALVPVFEVLRDPRHAIVDGVAIASVGEVFSVFLAHRGELRDVRRVVLDSASLTSVHLLKVLLAEFHGLAPEYVVAGLCEAGPGSQTPATAAHLLIGNQAIEFRRAHERDGWRFLDLGAEWLRCTGLPFVFAVWALRENFPGAADAFRLLKTRGLERLSEIVHGDAFADEDFRARYLGGWIHFDLDDRAKAGLAHFRELLAKHGFIGPAREPLVFV